MDKVHERKEQKEICGDVEEGGSGSKQEKNEKWGKPNGNRVTGKSRYWGLGVGKNKDWNVRAGQNIPYLAYHIHVGKRWSYIVGSVKFAISPQLWKYMYIKTHSRRNTFTGHGMEFYRTLGNICSEPQ
jgi:hypothetical protein